MKTVKIHILIGLPGSGKTTWALKYKENFTQNNYKEIRNKSGKRKNILYVDLDSYNTKNSYYWEQKLKNMTASQRISWIVNKELQYCFYEHYDEIIYDGLIFNSKGWNHLIEATVNKYLQNIGLEESSGIKFEVIFHRWNQDIETCLWNDSGRRNTDSVITIKNAIIENIDLESEKNKFKDIEFSIEEHTVVRASEWDKFYSKYGDTITSNEWSNGGTWGNYMGQSGTIYAEDPLEFEELDTLLEQYWPSITFLQYKKLKKECVELKDRTENDYYGGSEEKSWWECDTKKLFDFLYNSGAEINW